MRNSELELLEMAALDYLNKQMETTKARFNQVNSLIDLLNYFLFAFESVFEADWEYTKSCLKINDKPPPDEDNPSLWIFGCANSFLSPSVEHPYLGWDRRGNLLKAYRELLEKMEELGVKGDWVAGYFGTPPNREFVAKGVDDDDDIPF